jgi:hypothetical protein
MPERSMRVGVEKLVLCRWVQTERCDGHATRHALVYDAASQDGGTIGFIENSTH